MTPRTLVRPEKTLYYQVSELDASKETLLLLHGVFGHVGYWRDYEAFFEDRYNIISVDLRGHGKSFRPKRFRDYHLEHSVQDLRDILQAEGVNKVIVASASLANFVTVRLTAESPELVTKLILISFNGVAGGPIKTSFLRGLLFVLSLINWFPHKLGNHDLIPNIRSTYDWHWYRLFVDIFNAGPRSALSVLRSFFHFRIYDDIPLIRVPVLLIHGREDSILPYRTVKRDLVRFQNAELRTIDDGDHMICQTHLDEVLEYMNQFLSSTTPRRNP